MKIRGLGGALLVCPCHLPPASHSDGLICLVIVMFSFVGSRLAAKVPRAALERFGAVVVLGVRFSVVYCKGIDRGQNRAQRRARNTASHALGY